MTATAKTAVEALWHHVGGAHAALNNLYLSGGHHNVGGLPSSFRIGVVAQATIAAVGLAAAALWHAKTGRWQRVSVDMRHAAIEFRSERYLQVDGKGAASLWDELAGLYVAADERPVRLHTNFAHHRQAILDILGCAPTRDAVQHALRANKWTAVAFEEAVLARGGAVAALHTHSEWQAHEQGRAVAAMPALTIERIGDAAPRPLSENDDRPLSGVRVLDLTRIIAGPVAGRALAAHGAEVMLISAPGLPSVDWLVKDTGRGKLSAYCDLSTDAGRQDLANLAKEADVFIDGFRPGSLEARGFGPAHIAKLRPGIVYASVSAYGADGPWANRRGFDSLVQTASGFNHAEGEAFAAAAATEGQHVRPMELPAQALDHAAGYLLAFGVMMARLRQSVEGGSWLVRVSLAQTGQWIWQQGRALEDGFSISEPTTDEVEALLETSESQSFGSIRAVRHAAQLSETPTHWSRPTVALGADEPAWPNE